MRFSISEQILFTSLGNNVQWKFKKTKQKTTLQRAKEQVSRSAVPQRKVTRHHLIAKADHNQPSVWIFR